MAKNFIDFILDCEKKGGGALLRDYLAKKTKAELKTFFKEGTKFKYEIAEPELEKLWKAKDKGSYFSIDYEYINGPGKSY